MYYDTRESEMLDENVKICFDPCIDILNQVSLNSGTYFADDEASDCGSYLYNGYLPLSEWIPISSENEKILLDRGEGRCASNTLFIGKIPQPIFDYARSIGVHEFLDQDAAINFAKTDDYEKLRKMIFDFFYEYLETPKGLCFLKLACQPSALKVSTLNTHTQRLLGLHFDSWDGLKCEERSIARNRMCINFGKESRHFIFVNLTLSEIIAKANIDLDSIKVNNDILQLFFSRFPQYKVAKIQIKPGEYYIAPTENILHDGSTSGKLYPDIFLTILGHFIIPVSSNIRTQIRSNK